MATLVKVHPDGRYEMKDGGSMVNAIQYNEEGVNPQIVGHKPMLGCCLQVGSPFARTYGSDWWLTTVVTEILEENEKEITFKTLNSTYKLIL